MIALDIAAVVVVISVVAYVVIYSAIYDWYKNPLGIVLNLSLLSNATTAIGFILMNKYPEAGTLIMIFGWISFVALLTVRGTMLVGSAEEIRKKQKQEK